MVDDDLPVDGYGAAAKPSSREAVGEGAGASTRMLLGLKALARDNPWPEFGYGEIEPFFSHSMGMGMAVARSCSMSFGRRTSP